MSFTVNGLGDAEFEEVDIFTARSNTQGAPSSVFDYAATRVSLANFQNHITAYLNTQLSETRVSLGNFANDIDTRLEEARVSLGNTLDITRVSLGNTLETTRVSLGNFANQITADNLASQESLNTELQDIRVSLTDLTNRMDILDGGGNFTIEPVTWTNLTEINLSGEKARNISFDPPPVGLGVEVEVLTSLSNGGKTASVGEVYTIDLVQPDGDVRLTGNGQSLFASANQLADRTRALHPSDGSVRNPYLWSVNNGIIDQTKLSEGIIKGSNGSVGIDQMFSSPLAIGTRIVVKVTRADFGTGGVAFKHLKANGDTQQPAILVPSTDGFVEYEVVTSEMHGIGLSTQHGTHEISSVSVFQGAVSGGSVQTFTGGSIEKISGVSGYNAGASSVQKIDGQKDGYVQFQIGSATNSVRVGIVTQDSDYEVDLPFKLHFGNGKIDLFSPFLNDQETYEIGDWFRIRHYSTNNEIHFQKREDVYEANLTGSYEVGTKILILRDFSSAIKDEIVTIYVVNSSGVPSFEREDGTRFGSQAGVAGFGRTDWWEVTEFIGQDYVTFYTHPTFSNGDDFYFDTSFYSVGSRLNDVQIARATN